MKELKYSSIKNDYISDTCTNVATCLFHSHMNFSIFFTLKYIIINIRGQIENRPLENSCCAGRKWLPAGCKCIYGPAADWLLDHHPMDLNQSSDFVDAGKPFMCCTF